jgi:hypothetical protein
MLPLWSVTDTPAVAAVPIPVLTPPLDATPGTVNFKDAGSPVLLANTPRERESPTRSDRKFKGHVVPT